MSYFFPHQTREEKRQKTVELFEKHCQAMKDIQKRVEMDAIKTTPLFNELMIANKNTIDWDFDTWRDVYVQHDWTEIEGEKWFVSKTNVKNKSNFNEVTNETKKLQKEELELHEESLKWTDFEKTINGVYYKKQFLVDADKHRKFYWAQFNSRQFMKRLELIKTSSYDIDLLSHFKDTTIYIHEAFLILLGVAPDTNKMKRKEFRGWMLSALALDFDKRPKEINHEWFKNDYTDFDEWQLLLRRFFKDQEPKNKTGLEHEINTSDFIKWAISQEYIEEDTAHYRDGRKAPYDESFSKMLHEELLVNDLIQEGKHHHEWIWNKTTANGANSFNYLGKLLALNRVPIKYWLPYDKHSVSWKDLQHYIVGVKTPQNHSSEPMNMRTIENIVKKLLLEHDNRPIEEYKDL